MFRRVERRAKTGRQFCRPPDVRPGVPCEAVERGPANRPAHNRRRSPPDDPDPMNQQTLSALIWSVADLLRGDFKQSEYGRVILPFTVLRRLDCVLAPTKAAVLAEHRDKEQAGLLYLVVEKFAHIEPHPRRVDNVHMGLVFEELIRKFAEISNETAGEHFTPRELIRLMVSPLFIEDDEALSKPGIVRTIYDPTAGTGTGRMLSVAGEHLHEIKPGARLTMFGQELNPESYAICKADMLIKGQDVRSIVLGNTLSETHIGEITRLLGEFLEAEQAVVSDAQGKELARVTLFPEVRCPAAPAGGKVKRVPIARVFRNQDFGYRTITIERPLRDAENVPLFEDVQAWFEREVLSHAPDAWIDHDKTRIGYEIPLNRHFYVFEPPRPLAEIDADLKRSMDRIKQMIEGLAG